MISGTNFANAVILCDRSTRDTTHAISAYRTFQAYWTLPSNLKKLQTLAYNIDNSPLPEGSAWAQAVGEMDTVLVDDPRLSEEMMYPRVCFMYISRMWRNLSKEIKMIFYAVSAIKSLRKGMEWVYSSWDEDHPQSERIAEEEITIENVRSMSRRFGPLNLTGPYTVRALRKMGVSGEPEITDKIIPAVDSEHEHLRVYSQSYTFTSDPERRALFAYDPFYMVFFWIGFPSYPEYRESILPLLGLTASPASSLAPSPERIVPVPATPPHRITRQSVLPSPPPAPVASRKKYHTDLLESVGSRVGNRYTRSRLANAISELQREGFVPNTYEGARDFEEQYLRYCACD
jgi:hypothetical protein